MSKDSTYKYALSVSTISTIRSLHTRVLQAPTFQTPPPEDIPSVSLAAMLPVACFACLPRCRVAGFACCSDRCDAKQIEDCPSLVILLRPLRRRRGGGNGVQIFSSEIKKDTGKEIPLLSRAEDKLRAKPLQPTPTPGYSRPPGRGWEVPRGQL